MPFIRIQTSSKNLTSDEKQTFLKDISYSLSLMLKKPENRVMTSFSDNVSMTFAGSFEPACFVELKNIGKIASDVKKRINEDLCLRLSNVLDLSEDRIFIVFEEKDGGNWGWSGKSF